MRVLVSGALFTEYHTNSSGKPILWPLIGPSGTNLVRQWPVGEHGPHEATDHPHHRGVWFGYDKLNGVNFWHDSTAKRKRGRVVHQEFVTADSDGDTATLTTRNEWISPDDKVVCSDERTLRFGAGPNHRWVDFLIRLTPVDKPLRIGDSKEGVFAVRVAGWLREDAKQGGTIVNAEGQSGKKAWGRRATWVDYWGALNDTKQGVAILSHPSNFRAKPRWHVRGYGLFAANPFGENDFPKINGYKQGPRTINKGEELRLRYRLVLHLGDADEANINALYHEYAAQ